MLLLDNTRRRDCLDSLEGCCIFAPQYVCDDFANDILGRNNTAVAGDAEGPDDGDLLCPDFYTKDNRTLMGNADGNATMLEDICAEYCFSEQFMVANDKTQVVSITNLCQSDSELNDAGG
jgi:hypothetical protein